jgi:hypothetical protein
MKFAMASLAVSIHETVLFQFGNPVARHRRIAAGG